MPTGYTFCVERGEVTELKDFILRCARAMGALVHMRDEPLDAPITPREPSDHYQKSLDEAKADLERWQSLSDAERIAEVTQRHEESVESRRQCRVDWEAENTRYQAMLEKVTQWRPPTPDHQGLKDFMVEQLKTSMHTGSFVDEPYPAIDLAATVKDRTEHLRKQVERYTQLVAEEVSRCAEANAWVDALVASLPAGPAEEGTAE